jgi:NodT family efflux transporter outer membrane factor (OMF) lipoprotein
MNQTTTNLSQMPRQATAALAMLVLIGTAGCVVGPRYVKPGVEVPSAYRETAAQTAPDGTQWSTAKPQDATPRGQWWEIYGEPELNDLEEKLNASNQNVAQSYENFVAARALVRQALASYFPTLTTSPSATRSNTPTNTSGGEPGVTSNSVSLPLDISWEPDLWGRVRNTVRQYANAAQVSAADLANERLSQQSSLATYYFELRGQDSLLALYQQTILADQKSLDLSRVLQKTGIESAQDVAEADLNLKSAQASATNLGVARAQYEHAIAVLIGLPPASFSLASRSLMTPNPPMPVGVPSDLLQRRPDIAAAERTMSEANALIGVQTAAFYPTLILSASGGVESSAINNLLSVPSRFFSIGPSLSQTLFDGGSRRATLENYQAQYQADVAAYRQAVLTAFQQTEDNLASQRILTKQMEQQRRVVDAAQKYFDLSVKRYKTGVDSYLNVFTAQTSLLTQQKSQITLQVQLMTSSVQLIEALGGGWDMSQLPSEKQVRAN